MLKSFRGISLHGSQHDINQVRDTAESSHDRWCLAFQQLSQKFPSSQQFLSTPTLNTGHKEQVRPKVSVPELARWRWNICSCPHWTVDQYVAELLSNGYMVLMAVSLKVSVSPAERSRAPLLFLKAANSL